MEKQKRKNTMLSYLEKNNSKLDRIWFAILAVAVLFRIGLALRLPYNGIANAGFDDAWLVRAAEQIASGNWLGEYSHLTLIKGISFPLFIVLAKILCIPYGMLLMLYYALAAVVLIKAFQDKISNKYIQGLIFLWILYSPIGLSSVTGMRIYRNSILFPSVLLVIATVRGMLVTRPKLSWSIGLGLSFSFFYYIREDSIWLVPFVGVLIAYIILVTLLEKPNNTDNIVKETNTENEKDNKTANKTDDRLEKTPSAKNSIRHKLTTIAIALVPIAIFATLTLAYCTMNYAKYGIFITNDRTNGAFSDAVGAMLKVENEENSDEIWISRDTMERIVEECPTLEANHYDFMFMYDASTEGKESTPGDFYAWAFRQAIGRVGHDTSAQDMQAYCRQITDEIELALAEGRLEKDNTIHFSGQTRGLTMDQCKYLIKDSLYKMSQMVLLRENFNAQATAMNSGTREQYRYFESMTGVQVIYPQENKLELRGWIYLKNPGEQISLDLVDKEGNVLMHGISLYESKNVARYTGDDNAAMSQFIMELSQVQWFDYAQIAVYREGELYMTLPIENYEDDVVRLNVDAFQITTYDDAKIGMSGFVIKIANIFVRIGKILAYPLFFGAIAGYVLSIVAVIKNKTLKEFEDFMFMTGCILSLFVSTFMIGIFGYGWLDSLAVAVFYGVGSFAFVYVFEIYGCAVLLCLITYKKQLHADE